MRHLDIKITGKKLQEQEGFKYTVIVVYIDGEKYQITDILKTHMDAPTFADAIKKMAQRKFPNKEFKTFYVVGNDGKKVDGYDFDVLKRDELDPDGVPDKTTDDNTDNKGDELTIIDVELPPPPASEVKQNIEDAAENSDEVDEKEIEVTVDEEEPAELTVGGVTLVSPEDLDKMMDEYADKVDKDGDGLNDETGEPVLRSDQLPKINLPKVGGGKDGDTGEEGVQGKEGAMTGEQRAEIPSIIEELYRSISGLGTNETRMINALKRIGSPAHLAAVVGMYKEQYGSSLPNDIIGEFKFQGGNTKQVIDEINGVMSPLGWEIKGSEWFNLGWEKSTSQESSDNNDKTEGDPTDNFEPTNEEREQRAEAIYIFDQIINDAKENNNWSKIDPIEYTDENDVIKFIRNPAEKFGLPDRPFTDKITIAVEITDLKTKIAELFPLIIVVPLKHPPKEPGVVNITVGPGRFAYTRQLEGEE